MNPAFLANAGSGGGAMIQPKSQSIADKCRSSSILSLSSFYVNKCIRFSALQHHTIKRLTTFDDTATHIRIS